MWNSNTITLRASITIACPLSGVDCVLSDHEFTAEVTAQTPLLQTTEDEIRGKLMEQVSRHADAFMTAHIPS